MDLIPYRLFLNALVPAVVRRHVGDKIQNSNSPAANSEERLRVLLYKLLSYCIKGDKVTPLRSVIHTLSAWQASLPISER